MCESPFPVAMKSLLSLQDPDLTSVVTSLTKEKALTLASSHLGSSLNSVLPDSFTCP